MRLSGRKFINIYNIREFGNYIANYNEKRDENVILNPVYKINRLESEYYEFIPGYIDKQNIYYKCPLDIFYIRLDRITQKTNFQPFSSETHVEAEITIFSKDFSKNRIEILKIDNKRSVVDFTSVNWIINRINEYINQNNDIDDLVLNQLYIGYTPVENDIKLITNYINKLKFNFYENSCNNVGKDNSFWDEAEVFNLPENSYLKKLFIEFLKKQSSIIDLTDYGLLMIFPSGRYFSPSHKRRLLKDQLERERRIKDALIVDIAIAFDSKEHFFARLKSNNL